MWRSNEILTLTPQNQHRPKGEGLVPTKRALTFHGPRATSTSNKPVMSSYIGLPNCLRGLRKITHSPPLLAFIETQAPPDRIDTWGKVMGRVCGSSHTLPCNNTSPYITELSWKGMEFSSFGVFYGGFIIWHDRSVKSLVIGDQAQAPVPFFLLQRSETSRLECHKPSDLKPQVQVMEVSTNSHLIRTKMLPWTLPIKKFQELLGVGCQDQ